MVFFNKSDLEIKIRNLREKMKKRIGIVGTRASGKTAFLTVLISTVSQKAEYSISVVEDKDDFYNTKQLAQEDIDNYFKDLQEKGTIGKTDTNWRLKLRISQNKFHYYVKTFDPTGEAYNQLITKGAERYFEEAKKLLKESFGIIFIMDYPTEHRKEIISGDSIHSVKLLTEKIFSFDENLKKHELEEMPFAIILSKIDKMEGFNYSNPDKEQIENLLEKEIKTKEGTYYEEYNRLKNQKGQDEIKVFGATIGYNKGYKGKIKTDNKNEFINKDDIITDIKPCGIREPFEYILKKREEVFLNEAKNIFRMKNGNLFKLKEARELFKEFYNSVSEKVFEDFYMGILNEYENNYSALKIIRSIVGELEGIK